MMTQSEQAKAAKKFSQDWKGKGYEKGESQKFWLDLLCNVFGVQDFADFITFEDQVKLDHTSFIDGYISATRVLIEQKSLDKNLREPIKQSDGSFLTPFQQAKRYITELPVSKHPRWVVTCNFKSFLVYDMENPNGEPEEILLENLEKEFYRLSFITATESVHLKKELEISKKAGDIIGEIYDAILEQYNDAANPSPETLKSLNMLCVRIVFCLYAEDAGIFGHKSMFGDFLKSFEAKDLRRALLDLFQTLDQKIEERDEYLEESLAAFPYVNGGLFTEEDRTIPQLTEEIKDLLVRHASSDFDWSEISPTIFGAIFESTLNPETRRSGGMHYTSIENIHKVIDPLFLDDLKTEFERLKEIKSKSTREQKIIEFQKKLGSLKFLDPACGSGNFLTETYLSLRKLENECLKIRFDGQSVLDVYNDTVFVKIHQFYGIEINDFAVSVAKTALWIAECQMLEETSRIVGRNLNFLPLKTYANIIRGNALRMDWNILPGLAEGKFIYADKVNLYKPESIKPADMEAQTHAPSNSPQIYDELNIVAKKVNVLKAEDIKCPYDYIMGNPPFVGQAFRTKEQAAEMQEVFAPSTAGGKLDYVAGWYKKAADLIKETEAECSFVSSNSICQGESVNLLWEDFLTNGVYINFAHTTFKWTSESTDAAAVMCVVVGFSRKERKEKLLFTNGQKKIVNHINGYLTAAPDIFIKNRSKSINAGTTTVVQGSPPADDGKLLLSAEEREEFIKKYPELKSVIKPFVGSKEFINDTSYSRYCFWFADAKPSDFQHIKELRGRFEYVHDFRLKSPVDRIQKTADKPYLFTQNRQPKTDYLIIPRVSSSKRRYIPIGFLPPDVIASDAAVLVYDATLYEFGLISSNVHNAWMRMVAGRLKDDYRYAPSVWYNFPLASPSETQKEAIKKSAQGILDARKLYPNKSLADMYGQDMYLFPELLQAHRANDKAVMKAYGFSLKMTESECVAELFKMYEKLTQEI